MESFSSKGVSRGLYKDGVRVGDINERLNLTHDEQDWLSLRPSGALYVSRDEYGAKFGEFNHKNKLHGRGIHIFPNG